MAFIWFIHQEPLMGFEPATCSLRVSCSTPELKWHKSYFINSSAKLYIFFKKQVEKVFWLKADEKYQNPKLFIFATILPASVRTSIKYNPEAKLVTSLMGNSYIS